MASINITNLFSRLGIFNQSAFLALLRFAGNTSHERLKLLVTETLGHGLVGSKNTLTVNSALFSTLGTGGHEFGCWPWFRHMLFVQDRWKG